MAWLTQKSVKEELHFKIGVNKKINNKSWR